MILGALNTSYLARTQARDERKRKADGRKSETVTSGSLELEDVEDFVDKKEDPDDLAC